MILVTGAAGFIGKHLVKALLDENIPVVALDKANPTPFEFNIRYHQTDITDEAAMKKLEDGPFTACVHLAAVASPPIAQKDPVQAWATNVRGTHNVLQLLHRIGCPKIIFFSSAHVYGISPKYMPTDENHPLALLDTYTTTKIMGEELCRLYYENHGISYTTLRLWNAYGPGQNEDYFIGAKIRQAKTGKLTIRNERVTKDWVHVSDVVRATLLAVKSAYVGPLNVGTGIETSLTDIVRRIADRFGLAITKEDVPDEGPTRMQCDFRRIKATLGWEPKISFQDGLRELLK